MFHHVVMLSLIEPLEQKDYDFIVGACEEIKRELPGVLSIRFISNLSNRSASYSHAFVADFVDEAAHDAYQQAPIHVPLKKKVGELSNKLVVLDYSV